MNFQSLEQQCSLSNGDKPRVEAGVQIVVGNLWMENVSFIPSFNIFEHLLYSRSVSWVLGIQ